MTPEVRMLPHADPLSMRSLMRDLEQEYLIFDPFVAGCRRVDLHPLLLPRELHDDAVRAAEEVVRVVGAAAARAHDDATERAHYGLHEDVIELAAASHGAGDHGSLVRVDLLLDKDGSWKACEINADCPGGHNEAFGLPRLARAAGFSGGHNPTTVLEALADRLTDASGGVGSPKGIIALIYATAYAEDLQVCAIVERALRARGARTARVPATAPRGDGDIVRVGGAAVSTFYRYFPAEYMEGQENLPAIARAIRQGTLTTVSSFSQIYMQSKLAFARAWAGGDDHGVVAARLPATFELGPQHAAQIAAERASWVVKRAFGRVGDQVFVGSLFGPDEWAAIVHDVSVLAANGESWIAQRFVEQLPIPTPWGARFATLGAYVLDGRFVGYFARVTPESHASHDALVVPVFVVEGEGPS